MVRRVVDRAAPRLADAESLRDRHELVQAAFHASQVRPVDLARRPGRLLRVGHPPEQSALLQPPVDAGAHVEDHRLAFDVERRMRLGHDHLMARAAREDPRADQLADRAQRRSARQEHALGGDHAVGRLHAGDAPAPAARGRGPQPEERRPLAELHAGLLHRERVRADVPRRIDRAVRRAVAAAAMAVRRERRVERARLLRIDPPHVESGRPLHLDARVPVADVALGDGEDQVAELAEPGVGPQPRLLRTVEVDREPAERDRGRRAALRAHDAGRAARRTLSGQVLLQDDDPLGAARGGEPRRPPADHAGADDHQVRAFRLRHRPLRPTWGVSVAPERVRPVRSCGSWPAPRAAPWQLRTGASPRTRAIVCGSAVSSAAGASSIVSNVPLNRNVRRSCSCRQSTR